MHKTKLVMTTIISHTDPFSGNYEVVCKPIEVLFYSTFSIVVKLYIVIIISSILVKIGLQELKIKSRTKLFTISKIQIPISSPNGLEYWSIHLHKCYWCLWLNIARFFGSSELDSSLKKQKKEDLYSASDATRSYHGNNQSKYLE